MKVTANRNGETREFDQKLWEQMPEDKYGWKPAAETPDEVKAMQDSQILIEPLGDAIIEEPAAETPDEVKADDTASDQTKSSENGKSKKQANRS